PTPTTTLSPLSLHDALPSSARGEHREATDMRLGRKLDTGHAGSGTALRPHRGRREVQQPRIGGDEYQLVGIPGAGGGHDRIAVLERDDLPGILAVRVVRRDALDLSVTGPDRDRGGILAQRHQAH